MPLFVFMMQSDGQGRAALGPGRAVTAETTRGLGGLKWMWDNRTVGYAQDDGGDENYRIFAINVEGGGPARPLTPRSHLPSGLW